MYFIMLIITLIGLFIILILFLKAIKFNLKKAMILISIILSISFLSSLKNTPKRYFDFNWENEYEGYAISVSRDFLALRRNNLKIPSKYKGKPVIGINDYAFEFNRTEDGYKFITLKKIKIPNTVKYIGVSAFAHHELKEVKIPDSVVFIGEGAFANNKLKEVKIPDSVVFIGEGTFTHNELKKVKIPDSIVFVGANAFSGNNISKIEDIQLGAGLTDYWVFDEETGELKGHIGLPKNYDLVIPDFIKGKTVTSIALNSFYNINLKSVFIPDSVKHISEEGFHLSNWYNDTVIYGKAGSEAERYAKKHGMRFVAE